MYGDLTIIGSDNDLSPGRRQAIVWTNAGILLIGPFQWNFNRNSNIFIQENTFQNVACEMAAILSRPQCAKEKTGLISANVRWIAFGQRCLVASWLWASNGPDASEYEK